MLSYGAVGHKCFKCYKCVQLFFVTLSVETQLKPFLLFVVYFNHFVCLSSYIKNVLWHDILLLTKQGYVKDWNEFLESKFLVFCLAKFKNVSIKGFISVLYNIYLSSVYSLIYTHDLFLSFYEYEYLDAPNLIIERLDWNYEARFHRWGITYLLAITRDHLW